MQKLLLYSKKAGFWAYYFALYVLLTLLGGAAIGVVLFCSLGLFLSNLSLQELAIKGLMVGLKYARVWAGGLSLVLCVIKAYNLRKTSQCHSNANF